MISQEVQSIESEKEEKQKKKRESNGHSKVDEAKVEPAVPAPDIEKTLRKLLDLGDAQIFDLHMILQILRRKYNKNYL